MKEIYINGYDIQSWINEIVKSPEESMMVTISKPNAICCNYNLTSFDLEPIVKRIIEICNKNVFGKHKKFEAMTGIIVEEISDDEIPHYHIIFQRPLEIDYLSFEYRLHKTARLLNDKNFTFNLSDTHLHSSVKKILANPCYPDFVKVTNTHEFLGEYLTKGLKTRFYILNGRKSGLQVNEINIYRNYGSGNTRNHINGTTMMTNTYRF